MNRAGLKDGIGRLAWAFLWIVAFTIPWEKSIMIAGIGTITRLFGLLAAVFGVICVLVRKSFRPPGLGLLLMAVGVCWSVLTVAWALDRSVASAKAFTLVQLWILAWLIWEQVRTPARAVWLVAAYVLGSVVSSLWTLARFFQGVETYYRRYAAQGFEPNDLGLTLAISIPLGFYLSGKDWLGLRWLWRAVILFCIAAILLSGSRTAFIAACLGFAFPVWAWNWSSKEQKWTAVALAACLALGCLRLAPEPTRQRLSTLPQEVTTGTLHKRTQIWRAGIRVLRQDVSRMLFGVGCGNYAVAVKPILGEPARPGHRYVAHNSFLSVLVESGFIGFFLYALAALVVVAATWMLPPQERALYFAVFLVLLAGFFTLTWEHRKPVWMIAALVLAQWAVAFRSDQASRRSCA